MGQIVYNVKVTLPEPLNIIGVKAHTDNGGKSYDIELNLPENVSMEALQSVAAEFVQKLIDRTKELEQAKVAAAERSAKAKAARDEQVAAQIAQEEQHARWQAVMLASEQPLPFAKLEHEFSGPVFVVRDRARALSLAKKGTLPFIGAYSKDSQVLFAFENLNNEDRCERCAGELKPVGGGMTTRTLVCSGCGERVFREKEVNVPHSFTRGAVARV